MMVPPEPSDLDGGFLADGSRDAATAPDAGMTVEDAVPAEDAAWLADALPNADALPSADALPGADALPAADAGQPLDEACAAGVRTGFTEAATFLNVAACGPLLDYPTSSQQGSSACGANFHRCLLNDPRLSELAGTPAPVDTIAWLPYEQAACGSPDAVYAAPGCGGAVAQVAELAGSSGCEASGGCGQGYRLVLWTESWNWSTRLGGEASCRDRVNHACGYPGGTIAPRLAAVACCRD